jgi:UPF0755 protein
MAFEFTYQLYGPDTVDEAPGREIIFQIKKGESTMDIASKLELNLAIENKYSFYLKTKLQELTIMPGTYIINSSMTYKEILAIITDYSASIIKEEGTEPETEPSLEAESATETDTDSEAETETESEAEPEAETDAETDAAGQ